jgi:hypothetical protein
MVSFRSRARGRASTGVILGAGLLAASLGTSAAGAAAQDIWGTPPAPEVQARESPKAAPTTPPARQPRTTQVPVAATPEAPADLPAVAVPELNPNGSYSERLLAGLRQIVLRDFEGAIATLRDAAQLEPANARAFCHLGDAQLGKADWAEAKAAYETCARFAALAKDPRYATLAAVGSARVTELSQQSLSERRDAYVRLEAGTSDTAAKIMATSRIAAFDGLVVMDNDYAVVRKRIAEREAAAAKAK